MARVSSTDTVQQSARALADRLVQSPSRARFSPIRGSPRARAQLRCAAGARARGQLGEMSAGSLFLTVLAPPMRTASSKGAS